MTFKNSVRYVSEHGYIDNVMIYELYDKEKAVKRVLDGENITAVSNDIGVTRGSLYTWIERYKSDGFEGLLPRSRRPESSPKSLDDDSVSMIIETTLDNPADDIRSLKLILKDEGLKLPISTIHKYLKRNHISTQKQRKKLLLLWFELEGGEYLGPQRIKGLEALSRHFAEREYIAKKSGENYYVLIEHLKTGSLPYTEIRVWHFIDLHSFHVTSVIEDQNEWGKESRKHYKKFLESNNLREDHENSYCFPIFVWWKAFMEKKDHLPITLILRNNDFFTVSKDKLSSRLRPTNISLVFKEASSTLPWAFISDFRSNFRNKYSNLTLPLSIDEPMQKRYRFFSQYIEHSLTAYNKRKLSALFPMSRATPNNRSNLPEEIKQNPSIELSHFLDSWESGKKLFPLRKNIDLLSGDDGGWHGTSISAEDSMRFGRNGRLDEFSQNNTSELYHLNKRRDSPGEMDDDFSAFLSSKGDAETSSGRHGRQGVPAKVMAQHELNEKAEQLKKNAFIRIKQEIDIKEHTNMDDPTCDLRKMNDKVPFKIVYEKLMDEKPKGKYWTCPRCGKKAMSYYPKPNGKHVNNNGFCHPDQAGCGNPTNSVNLIKFKLNYQFPQALKWFLANFDPVDYGIMPSFSLSEDDQKKYRH